MVTVSNERSATLLIRVWREGADDAFRSRLSSLDTSPGAGGEELTVGLASSPEEVVEAVRSWLDDVTGSADRDR
jgi:hypothetical protein